MCVLSFLKPSNESDQILTRASHVTPDSKQQSTEWRHTLSPASFKTNKHCHAAAVFWDRHGVQLVECIPQRQTINAEEYCGTLKEHWTSNPEIYNE